MSKTNAVTITNTPEKATLRFTGSLIAKSQLATCGPSLAKSNKDKGPTPVPSYVNESGRFLFMPGAGMRSKLRGAACSLIFDALALRGAKQLSLTDAQLNRVGGIKQVGSEPAIRVEDYLAMIAANPIVGLFGASTPWVAGKVSMGHISCKTPDVEPMVVDGVRANIFRREPGMVEYLAPGSMDEYMADVNKTKAYSAIKAEMKDLLRSAAKARGDERKDIQTKIAALEKRVKDDDLKHVSSQMPLEGYQSIPPGSTLEQNITLAGVTQIELGCFLASMRAFSQNPVLGAHAAHGAGVIAGTWEFINPKTGSSGSITVDPDHFPTIKIETTDAFVLGAEAAFNAFIASDECQPYSDPNTMMAVSENEGE